MHRELILSQHRSHNYILLTEYCICSLMPLILHILRCKYDFCTFKSFLHRVWTRLMFTCVFRRPVTSTVLLLKPFRLMGTIPVDSRAEVKIPIQQLNQLQLSGRNGVGECIVGVSGNIGLCTLLGLTPNSTDKPNKRPKDRSLRSHCKAFSLNAV